MFSNLESGYYPFGFLEIIEALEYDCRDDCTY